MTSSAAGTSSLVGMSHQVAFWTNETMDARIAMVGPMGCGKTLALCIKAFLLAERNRGIDGMLVVPTFNMFRMVHMSEWPDHLSKIGIEITWSGQDFAFLWPWGSKLWIRSAENPQRLAGPNLAFVLFDEPGQIKREAWERAALRARHPAAKLRQVVAGGTPEGINFFADLFAEPKGVHQTIWADEWHPSIADYYYKSLVETYGYDESLLASYAEGQFVPLRKGRCYRQFVRAVNVCHLEFDPLLPLSVTCDFNVDHMSWLTIQETSAEIRVLEEQRLGDGGTTEEAAISWCQRWLSRIDTMHMIGIYGDSSGKARTTKASQTDYRVIAEVFKSHKFERISFHIPPGNPSQKDRIDAVNYNLSGRKRQLLIDESCRGLIKDMERVCWRPGTSSIDKSDLDLTHASDALGYWVWVSARPKALSRARRGTISAHHPAIGRY